MAVDLAVHIVEDHDEALPCIYRAIAHKKLPFTGNWLIHFDSHPDLLSPDIKADDVRDKDLVYSSTTIADWILPAVYMGHVVGVVWVKPPWAGQMPNGRHTLVVGKDVTSGQIRVATPLPYFLSEVLWVPKSDLTNVKEIPLDVVTLHPQPHPSQTRSPTSSQREVHHQCSRDTTTSVGDEPLPDTVNRHNKRLQAKSAVASSEEQQSSGPASKRSCISSSPPEGSGGPCSLSLATDSEWILDIDLDFFSTGNPYRDLFSEEQFSLLLKLYQLPQPADASEEALCACSRKRRDQLQELRQLWETRPSSDDDSGCGSVEENLALSAEERKLLAEIKGSLIGMTYSDCFIDPDYLHTSGIVSDLPVHVSSEREVAALMEALRQWLKTITNTPAIVTIARSTEDEYTPARQVEALQEQVVHTLTSTLQSKADHTHKGGVSLEIHHDYLEAGEEASDSPSASVDQ